MPRTIETVVYQYDELNERAKDKAREWFREGLEFDADCVFDNAIEVAKAIGLDAELRKVRRMDGVEAWKASIYYSGFSHQGSGCAFDANWSASLCGADSVAKLKADRPTDKELHSIVDDFLKVAAQYPATVAQFRNHGNYFSMSADISLRTADREYDHDNAEDRAAEDALREAARNFAHWIYKALESEYEYRNADEQVAEDIRANEYEFTESGKRV